MSATSTEQVTTETQAKKMEQVRALLATAESLAETNPKAAENYTNKAMDLMARHGIDQALLDATAKPEDKASDVQIVVDNPYAQRKVELVFWVADALGCKAVHKSRWVWDDTYTKRSQVHTMHIFGMQSDLDRFQTLYTSLLVQATRGLLAAEVPYWESAKAFRGSWLQGFAAGVASRLREAEARAKKAAQEAEEAERARRYAEQGEEGIRQEGPGVALVLANRADQVAAKVAAEYPRLKTRSAATLSGSGMGAGYRAGRNADLGGTRLGGSRRGIGS